MCVFSGPQIKPRPKITLTHNKTKEHIDGRIHMCELYLSSVCCFGLLNHASATWFFYLYICARCFGLLNHASSTRFFYLYICASYDASIVLIQASRVHILRFTDLPKLSSVRLILSCQIIQGVQRSIVSVQSRFTQKPNEIIQFCKR